MLSFVEANNEVELSGFLPVWPGIYIKFISDVDRRIRELCCKIHMAMIRVFRKELAPYLKTIIGPWLAVFSSIDMIEYV